MGSPLWFNEKDTGFRLSKISKPFVDCRSRSFTVSYHGGVAVPLFLEVVFEVWILTEDDAGGFIGPPGTICEKGTVFQIL
jgi:hypothetical protein